MLGCQYLQLWVLSLLGKILIGVNCECREPNHWYTCRTIVGSESAAAVCPFAYLWGWPLVSNLNRDRAVEKLPEPRRVGSVIPMAPLGQVSLLTDYIDEKERFVTCSNQDNVYRANGFVAPRTRTDGGTNDYQ